MRKASHGRAVGFVGELSVNRRTRKSRSARRVCFVTGTRAEFGLMRTALQAIDTHPKLRLQLLITGMHLDRRHGRSLDQINAEGWLERHEHAVVPWRAGGG